MPRLIHIYFGTSPSPNQYIYLFLFIKFYTIDTMYIIANIDLIKLSVFRDVLGCIGLPIYLQFQANLIGLIINYIENHVQIGTHRCSL